MSKKIQRRSFLGRLSLAVSAALLTPLDNISRTFRKEDLSDMQEEKESIGKIQALGFQWETRDPFLFCVHHEDKFPKGNDVMGPDPNYFKGRHMGDDFIIKDGFRMYHGKTVPGFPGHPHRGFETITVVREGLVDHADSMGASGRYGNGDVQWMTAGKGVQHSEMFPLIEKEKENPMELFQIWLNLPAADKMVEPHFKMLWKDSIPVFEHLDTENKSTKVEVIAGSIEDKKAPTPPPNSWAAKDDHHVAVWNIKMEACAVWTLPKAIAGINRTLYFYEGATLKLAGKDIPKYSSIEVEPDHDIQIQAGEDGASILMLQGKPISETVMQYGPFVMNTKEEIQQAFEDYHKTQFGGWPWPKYDQVHDRTKGRFAKHADGQEEVKTG